MIGASACTGTIAVVELVLIISALNRYRAGGPFLTASIELPSPSAVTRQS